MLGRQSHPAAALTARLDHLLASATLAHGRTAETPPRHFAFRIGSVPFEASITPQGDGTMLILAGTLGLLPFSAENAPLRRHWLDRVGRNRGADRFSFNREGCLRLESRTLLPGNPTRSQLLEALTVVVMTLGDDLEPPLRH